MITKSLYIANQLIKYSKCIEEEILFKNQMNGESRIL